MGRHWAVLRAGRGRRTPLTCPVSNVRVFKGLGNLIYVGWDWSGDNDSPIVKVALEAELGVWEEVHSETGIPGADREIVSPYTWGDFTSNLRGIVTPVEFVAVVSPIVSDA